MRIIYIITGLSIGGAEKQVVLLANEMLKCGHEVSIISLTGNAMVKPDSGVTLHSLNMKKNFWGLIVALIRVNKIIKRFDPDVVHSHMFHANIFSRLQRIFTRFDILICTAHSSNEGNKLRMFMYNITDRLASLSTNVSEEAVNTFLEKKAALPGRMVCVYNGIDIEKFNFSEIERERYRKKLNISLDTHVILSVGRLTEAKDYPNLLRAYKVLKERKEVDRESIVIIVGSGDLENSLKEYALKLNISENVSFLGTRDDIEKIINVADVFVLSSEWEGFGLVVAEAMACERLVVATDSGGIREVVGDCGYIVPTKNYRVLADNIIKALELSEKDKRNIGLRSRKRIIDCYSINAVVDKWQEIYTELSNKISHAKPKKKCKYE